MSAPAANGRQGYVSDDEHLVDCGLTDGDMPLSPDIDRLQGLIDQTPPRDPDLPRYYMELGVQFLSRYDLETSEGWKDLETSEGRKDLDFLFAEACFDFRDTLQGMESQEDNDAVIQQYQTAVELTSQGNPARAGYLKDLGHSLLNRYNDVEELKDLDRALQNFQEAVDLSLEGDIGTRTNCLQATGRVGPNVSQVQAT
ncbi:hypothetical protein B0H13DRAFT_1866330 [Mycena leptocephala]|nr:hypothetical protein B0H13DRAFT_1866330 [Mycena leptocephala]